MPAPPGAIVKLTYDWHGADPPADGDCIVTSGGSAYAILGVRHTGRPGRAALTCLKLDGRGSVPAGARVLELYWYRRERRRR